MTRTTFIVISEGADGGHIAGTLYAADLYDARQTHHDSYANEPLVAFHQQRHRGTPPFAAMASHEPSGIWAGEGPDRHLARIAVECARPTEGQPDTRQTKQRKELSSAQEATGNED